MSLKKDITWRVGLVYVIMLLGAMAIVARIVFLQFVQGAKWIEKEKNISLKDIRIEPNRGDILDCKGRILATSIPFYEIRMDVSHATISEDLFREKIDSLAFCLSRLFKDKPKSTYKKELWDARIKDKRYFLIKSKVNYNDLKQIKTFPIIKLGKNKGGLIVSQDNMRIQPHLTLASRTIGYISKSESGSLVGLEGAFNDDLTGVTGIKIMQKIAGNIWMPVNDENEVEPKDGCDIVSTIDISLQDVAENALRRQLLKHNAHHGTAIVMEVKTGEIKAITNLEQDSNGCCRELYNYAIGESTEPGSTFKLPSLMAAMEDGYITLNDTVDTGHGSICFYDKTIYDSDKKGYGIISLQHVFEVSSNVGVSKVITKYYTGREKKFIDRLYNFGLNKKLNLEIKGEGSPDIKYPGDKLWSGISLPMMSHGYEVKMTPLQILTFYNAVANEGKMVKPRFVKEIRFYGNIVKKEEIEVLNPSICSSATLKMAKRMLEGVVENGTAKNLKNNRYKIAGKTGTAQIAKQGTGYRTEAKISYQASFCGYFPADNPKYSCIVVVNAPSNGVYYGNLVAGPVFKEIADKVYATTIGIDDSTLEGRRKLKASTPAVKNGHYEKLKEALDDLGIPFVFQGKKTSEWVISSRDSLTEKLTPKKIIENLVPDVTGMGIQDALYIIENAGLRATVKGYGKVISQSVVAGTKVTKGECVYLKMSSN